ncbi:MAG: hypothetical protein L3K13_03200 [Thermoplasmata archaeon]|nr:hypothetical protein [Thermoplasmata archaeon]
MSPARTPTGGMIAPPRATQHQIAGIICMIAGVAAVLGNLLLVRAGEVWPNLVLASIVGGGMIALGAYFLTREGRPIAPHPPIAS